jgi:hypothetical protein
VVGLQDVVPEQLAVPVFRSTLLLRRRCGPAALKFVLVDE